MAKNPKIVVEQQISEDIKGIVAKCISALKRQSSKDTDIGALEKLTKIYVMMAADTRENLKAGITGSMTDEQLEALAGDEEADEFVDGAAEK